MFWGDPLTTIFSRKGNQKSILSSSLSLSLAVARGKEVRAGAKVRILEFYLFIYCDFSFFGIWLY